MNKQGDMGNTALHNAFEHEDSKITSILLEAGADPSIENEFGDDCLAWAISFKNEAGIILLRNLSLSN